MSEAKSSKLSYFVAILGWIVAVLSLVLNWVIYTDNQNRIKAKEKEIPTFTYDLATYDLSKMPDQIKSLKSEITHNFAIHHKTGRTIKSLVAEFSSEQVPIKDITITEGTQGATTKVEPSGLEASLKKAELLPSQSIRGYVTTEGIAKLKLVVAADEGKKSEGYVPFSSDDSWIDTDVVIILLIMFGIGVVLVLILSKAMPAIQASGILPSIKETPAQSFLLILLLIVFLIPDIGGILPRINNLLYALIAYFVITNYKNIVKAIENLANKSSKSEDSSIEK